MSEEVDKILNELKGSDKSLPPSEENADQLLEKIQEERRSKIDSFQLKLTLEDDEPSESGAQEVPQTENTVPQEGKAAASSPDDAWAHTSEPEQAKEKGERIPPAVPEKRGNRKNKKKAGTDKSGSNWKVLTSVLYGVLVLGISIGLACFLITGAIDMLGLNKSEQKIDIIVPEGATTRQIADELKEKGIIDHPFIFTLYSKVMGKDGTYKPHGEDNPVTLSANMGYNGVIAQLQSGKAREVVTVVIPEGYTVENIADTLEEKGVCEASAFYASMKEDEFDYDFIAALPENGSDESENRIYRLEGYLFPDTYEFYTDSSAKSVITKFLDNFDYRIDTTVRSSIKASGREVSLDQIITLASIIQAEAAGDSDMPGISRVLWNRLDNPDQFPRLECDATWNYINNIIPQPETVTPQQEAYYTYIRKGLPVGPICNPGLAAIKAAIAPSDDPEIVSCFYFASAQVNGDVITVYARTQEEHDRNRRKYNIY